MGMLKGTNENILISLRHKNIVIIYMLYFGDMVSLSPFLEILRREAVGSKITLVIDARFQEAVRYNPCIDTIIPVDRKKMGLSATWKLGKEIGKTHPDILMVLHGTTRTFLMAKAMKAKVWVGEMGNPLGRFFIDDEILVERRDCHAAEKYVKVLEHLGVSNLAHHGMQMYTCPAWEEGAKAFFAAEGVKPGDRLAGFSVGSSTAEKNWPAEKYGEVADHFAGLGYRPVFFGVPSEMPLIEKALAHMKCRDETIVAAGKLSMGEFIAAASWCAVAFTNDSGPMYVFDSRKVPVIAMFGPSNAKLHHPLGEKSCALATTDMPRTQDHVNHTIRDRSYTPIDAISVSEAVCAGEWALGMISDERYEGHLAFVEGNRHGG